MSERIYALFLRLYPVELRRTYGRDAWQLVRDRWRDERGVVQRLRLCLDLIADLLTTRLRARHKTPPPPVESSGAPAFQLLQSGVPRAQPLAAGMLLGIVMVTAFTQAIHAFGPDDRLAQLRTLKRLRSGFDQSTRLRSQAAPQPRQGDAFVARLLANRYSLSVRRGQLAGAAAPVLQSAIAQSRFVVLGEDHGTAQTPEFWAAVCKAAGPEGFHTLAVEAGPLVAAELEGWARQPDGLAKLVAFEKNFPESVNLYDLREEFDMLQQCAGVDPRAFHLWGLNEEALGAGGLMLSRVLAARIGADARPVIEQLLQKNDEAYRKAVQTGSIFDLFMITADDTALAGAAALLTKDGSAEARSLFRSLIESHEINRTSPAEYGNARRRERLMKTLFAADYTRAASAAPAPPKVLLKFGGYHAYRGLNPVHGSGIGNYVAEMAEGQAAQSLHIRFMPLHGSQPIHPRVGQPSQLRSFSYQDDPGSRYLQPMFANLLGADWTMFDLRPLRQDLNRPGAAPNPDLATLVFGYDLLVIVPEGRPSTEIR